MLIDDAALAAQYRRQWDALKTAGDTTPAGLKTANSTPRQETIGPAPVTLWFTPTVDHVDLNDAKAAIDEAQRGVLFLMFNPGPRDTLRLTAPNLSTSASRRRPQDSAEQNPAFSRARNQTW